MQVANRLVDYVRFSVADYTTLEDVVSLLPWEFSERNFGIYRYRKSATAFGQGVVVAWDGCLDGMGVMVQISGSALRDLESREGFRWDAFFAEWLGRGASFSRVDVAFDDVSAAIPMTKVVEAVEARRYTSRSQTSQIISKRVKGRSETTCYIGSRQSEGMLRIYQKGLMLGESDWVRFEFEFKDRKAQEWVSTFVASGWDRAAALCRSVVDFVSDCARGVVVSRQKVAGWWLDLISKSKARFSPVAAAVDTVMRRVLWLRKQVSASLWALSEVQGGGVGWLAEIIDHAAARPNERARRLVETTRKMQFEDDFTYKGCFSPCWTV